MKKNIFKILPLVSIFLLASCSKKIPEEIIWTYSLDTNLSIISEEQQTFLNGTSYSLDKGDELDHSQGRAISLDWNIRTINGDKPDSYLISLEEGDNSILYETKKLSFPLANLKSDTTYRVQLAAFYKDDNVTLTSDTFTFTTNPSIVRPINVEGLTNFRDLGCSKIKQGLIYRSEAFEDEEGNVRITKNGLNTINEVLGIKSEIDLRKPNEKEANKQTSSVEGVKYLPVEMGYNGAGQVIAYKDETLGLNNLAATKKIFEYLADNSNFPLVFHCSFGRDRTGYLAYLIKGLLGCSKDECLKDYMFTNFSTVGKTDIKNITQGTSVYVNIIEKYDGETLQEKVKNFLMDTASNRPAISEEILNAVIANLGVSND